MVELLSYALIYLNELDKFLVQLHDGKKRILDSEINTYNLLFLLERNDLCVQSLQSLLQLILLLEDGHLVLFLNGKLHLTDL